MWYLVGELRRIIQRPEGQAGKKYQVQILASETLQNGEVRESIFTLPTDNPQPFTPHIGRDIMVSASPYPRKDGTLGISITDGAVVVPASSDLIHVNKS